MIPQARVRTWSDLQPAEKRASQIDAVFFAASNTQTFSSQIERAAFRQLWLGQFLKQYPRLATVALQADGTAAGYCVVWPDDPRVTGAFADLDYFVSAADALDRFPAHLHINLVAAVRGQGLGSRLLAASLDALAAARPGRGVHIFTEAAARNRNFYRRNGFFEIASLPWRERRLVMMARV